MPERVELHRELETVWPVWELWAATDRRFLPGAGGLADQDEALMEDLLTIDALESKIRRQMEKKS